MAIYKMSAIQNTIGSIGKRVSRVEVASGAINRVNNFDFLRLFLAILVIFSHSFPLGLGNEISEPFHLLTHGQATGGYIAVDCFFIMSGFLITASFFRSTSALDYLGKRIRLVYPGFIVAMLFGALVVVPLAGGYVAGANTVAKINNVLGHIWVLHEPTYAGAFAHNAYATAVNGSAWSIVFEFWCYIAVLCLGAAGILSNRKLILNMFAATVLIGAGFSFFHPAFYGGLLGQVFGYPALWARLLPLFFAGMVAYLFRDRIKYNLAGCLISLSAIVIASFIPNAFGVVFPLAGGYLVFWLAFHPSIRFFNPTRFGDLSYGAYLFAFPIQQLIVSLFGRSVHPFLLFAMATPIVLLVALTSWHLIERPFLQGRKDADLVVPSWHIGSRLIRRLQQARILSAPQMGETIPSGLMAPFNIGTAELSRTQLADRALFYVQADDLKAKAVV